MVIDFSKVLVLLLKKQKQTKRKNNKQHSALSVVGDVQTQSLTEYICDFFVNWRVDTNMGCRALSPV